MPLISFDIPYVHDHIVTSGTEFESDRWYHVALTKSGCDYVLYVNGEWDVDGYSCRQMAATDDPLIIGCYPRFDGWGAWFDGVMDEIRIYNRALGGTEVKALFNEGTSISLDFLGYGFDVDHGPLNEQLEITRKYREERAWKILQKLNEEFERQGLEHFTEKAMEPIQ